MPIDGGPTARNACGGSTILPAVLQSACGRCGVFACDGTERVVCEESAPNACGECGPPPEETCNGFDDNCDGEIDERCSVPIGVNGYVFDVAISGPDVVLLYRQFRPRGTHTRAWLTTPALGDGSFLDPRSATEFTQIPGVRPEEFEDTAVFVDRGFVGWTRNVNPTGTRNLVTRIRERATGREWTTEDNTPLADLDEGRALVLKREVTREMTGEVIRFVYQIDDLRTGSRRRIESDPRPYTADLAGDWLVIVPLPRVGIARNHLTALHLRTGETRDITLPTDQSIFSLAFDGNWILVATANASLFETSVVRAALWTHRLDRRETRPLDAPVFAGRQTEGPPRIRVDGGLACWIDPTGALRATNLTTDRTLLLPVPLMDVAKCDVAFPTVVFSTRLSQNAYARRILPDEL